MKRLLTQSFDDAGASSSHENGVAEQLSDWPSSIPSMADKILAKTGTRSRLHDHFSAEGTVYVTTSYSGLGTFEHCVQRLMHCCSDKQQKAPRFRFWSGCENDHTARQMLMSSQVCPEHVFGDITDRVSSDVLEHLNFIVRECQNRAKELKATKQKEIVKKQMYEALSDRCMRKMMKACMEAIAADRAREPRTAFLSRSQPSVPALARHGGEGHDDGSWRQHLRFLQPAGPADQVDSRVRASCGHLVDLGCVPCRHAVPGMLPSLRHRERHERGVSARTWLDCVMSNLDSSGRWGPND